MPAEMLLFHPVEIVVSVVNVEMVSVKIARDKGRLVRLLKAEFIRAGEYDVTDADVLGAAVGFAFERKVEFASGSERGSISAVMPFAGSWNLSGSDASLLKAELRKWRDSKRRFAW